MPATTSLLFARSAPAPPKKGSRTVLEVPSPNTTQPLVLIRTLLESVRSSGVEVPCGAYAAWTPGSVTPPDCQTSGNPYELNGPSTKPTICPLLLKSTRV